MKSRTWTNVGRVILILLAISGAGIFMAFRTSTMINPWVVIIVSIVLAFPISVLCANKIPNVIGLKRLPLRIVTWMVLVAPIFTGSLYLINYCGADSEKSKGHPAVVERKYYETRERTRRVRKGRYIPTGETYRVYYADIRLDNGHLVTVPLTGSDITRVLSGQTLNVKVSDGTFGIPVVITRNIFDK